MSASRYDSRLAKIAWQNRLYPGGNHHLVFGLESEREEAESFYYSESSFGPYEEIFQLQTARTTGLFVQDRINPAEAVSVTVGMRLDDHDRFGTEATWRTAFSFRPGESGTRIKGSYGTGFKAPSLFQLYSSYGNENLEPEENTGWDVGIEQKLSDGKIVIEATWFRNDFENLVQFDNGSFTYQNLLRAETGGIEVSLSVDPVRRLGFQAGYTRTATEDLSTGEELLRRPNDKISLVADCRVTEKLGLYLDLTRVGTRKDLDFSTFPATRVELPGYTLMNLAGSWQVHRQVRINARIENLLNQEYQEVLGYGTPGFGGYLGFKLTL
jgi:vitamin B12 transporter